MRSPNDIKTGLECCYQYEMCIGCPYRKGTSQSPECVRELGRDSFLYILKLEGLTKKCDLLNKLEDDLK